jgi:type II secretory pathway pseudopilin PulG
MKQNNKRAFTIVEVSILFVIFLIVAFLVAPLSLDDTLQAKNTSRWKQVQSDFINISHTMQKTEHKNFRESFVSGINSDIKNEIRPYRITYMNGSTPQETYTFNKFYNTQSNATLAYNLYEHPQNKIYGVIMYDVNGQTGPNSWGKDVFGFYIFEDKLEPFGKEKSQNEQKQDCSKDGTGIYCSNYYLIGGNFD